MMRILAIANQKGGVGKTATTHALGVALANEGCHVLLVDLDPQGSLTNACGIKDCVGWSLVELMESTTPGVPPLPKVIRPLARRLSLIPTHGALAATQENLATRPGRERVLKRVLAPLGGYYHLCLIDCPPSLGLLTVNALVAAHAVLIPTQPQAADLYGLNQFLRTVDRVRVTLNPGLRILGILVTFYDQRLRHHREILEALEASGVPVLRTKIGRSVKVAEAVGAGESVVSYAAANPQAEAYRQLAKEIMPWIGG
jgi:chromosome partitioning protein